MFLKQMTLALKSDEAGIGNASGQLAAGLKWNHEITPHMHYQCRRLHFGEKIRDIEISHDIEISGSAFRRGRSAVKLVKTGSLLVRCPWNE